MTAKEVFLMAKRDAEEIGIGDSFMRFHSGARGHFVGHGIGLELNEPPLIARNSEAELKAGMVLALELHLMEPEGLTLKLEDTIILTRDGAQILTLSPRELIVA
jgi:Xaa-Pro aminopeptidase